MDSKNMSEMTRRGLLGAFAGVGIISAAPVYSKTFGYVRGAGNIRRLKIRSGRTGEMVDTIYWVDGQYIRPALEEINYFMRDWRQDAVAKIDRRTIDIMAASHARLDTDEPLSLLSGYRTSRTNNMLRSRSRGVAKKSYHVRAQAADLRVKSRSISQLARAAVASRSGGVGTYRRSNFVHVDSGPTRTWRG